MSLITGMNGQLATGEQNGDAVITNLRVMNTGLTLRGVR